MNIQLGDIGHIIQLSIAPVFLLTGVGHNLMVLTNRLARIIDRSRMLEDRAPQATSVMLIEFHAEYEILRRRGHLINWAITLNTVCALFTCLMIVALFVGDALNLALARVIAGLFVMGMLALICSFSLFLREIFIATDFFYKHGMPLFK